MDKHLSTTEEIKPRTSSRVIKGTFPVRFPDGVPQFAIQKASTHVIGGGINMSRTTMNVSRNVSTRDDHEEKPSTSSATGATAVDQRDDDRSSTVSKISTKTQKKKMLELKKIKLMKRLAELDIEKVKLEIDLLEDDESQYLGSDEEEERKHERNSQAVVGIFNKRSNNNEGSNEYVTSNVKANSAFGEHNIPNFPRAERIIIPSNVESIQPESIIHFPLQQHRVRFEPGAHSTPIFEKSRMTEMEDPQPSSSTNTLAMAQVDAFQQQNLNTERFVARQSSGSQLPIFSGNPLDWPIFIHHYRQSTIDCGYSPAQNMGRLEKAVQGEARKSVRALMIIPNNSDMVINRLEQRYGRPGYVIQALVDLAKRTPSPREGRLAGILDYANCINNLVTTVKALKTNAHLYNPQLIKELVDKLPDGMKLQRGEFVMSRSNSGGITLEDLSIWINRKAAAASVVTVPDFKRSRGKEHDNVMTAVETSTGQNLDRKCVICCEHGHIVAKCEKFKSYDVDGRWKLLKEKQLCIACLGRGHGVKVCRRKKVCNVSGCQRNHHPLLHAEKKIEPRPPEDKNTDVNGLSSNNSSSVLLRVTRVKLYGTEGKTFEVCAIFDECSTVSMIDSELAGQLGLKGRTDPLRLKWTDGRIRHNFFSLSVLKLRFAFLFLCQEIF